MSWPCPPKYLIAISTIVSPYLTRILRLPWPPSAGSFKDAASAIEGAASIARGVVAGPPRAGGSAGETAVASTRATSAALEGLAVAVLALADFA
ncbi:MAG: hypothetical protein ACREH9_03330, partial [Pseudomonadota bacterium]